MGDPPVRQEHLGAAQHIAGQRRKPPDHPGAGRQESGLAKTCKSRLNTLQPRQRRLAALRQRLHKTPRITGHRAARQRRNKACLGRDAMKTQGDLRELIILGIKRKHLPNPVLAQEVSVVGALLHHTGGQYLLVVPPGASRGIEPRLGECVLSVEVFPVRLFSSFFDAGLLQQQKLLPFAKHHEGPGVRPHQFAGRLQDGVPWRNRVGKVVDGLHGLVKSDSAAHEPSPHFKR